jgi:hypothetical protein
MEPDADMDAKLRAAIDGRRLIKFSYDGKRRKAEPHDYGIQNAVVKVFCYQLAGGSKAGRLPDWRLLLVSKISELELTDETFNGPRPVAGNHLRWDELFASVSRAARAPRQN